METLTEINQAAILEAIREPARRVIELRRKAAVLRAICPLMGADPEQVMVAKSDLRQKFIDLTLKLV